MGDKTLTFEIYRKGKKEIHNRSLRILSDIEPAQLHYEVVATYKHDANSYTQGLQYEQGKFYESAGLYEESSVRYVDVKTGNVLKKNDVEPRFGMMLLRGMRKRVELHALYGCRNGHRHGDTCCNCLHWPLFGGKAYLTLAIPFIPSPRHSRGSWRKPRRWWRTSCRARTRHGGGSRSSPCS